MIAKLTLLIFERIYKTQILDEKTKIENFIQFSNNDVYENSDRIINFLQRKSFIKHDEALKILYYKQKSSFEFFFLIPYCSFQNSFLKAFCLKGGSPHLLEIFSLSRHTVNNKSLNKEFQNKQSYQNWPKVSSKNRTR